MFPTYVKSYQTPATYHDTPTIGEIGRSPLSFLKTLREFLQYGYGAPHAGWFGQLPMKGLWLDMDGIGILYCGTLGHPLSIQYYESTMCSVYECTSQILGPLLRSFALFARQVDSPACLLPELPGFLVRMLQGDILDRIFRMFLLVCTSACNR